MLRQAGIPYWRLSGFYFFYFAFLGAWVPFWNLYLEKSLHFTANQIGILSALVLGTKMVGPYVWGLLSDHYGNRISIIRIGAAIAFFSFFGVFWRQDFAWLFLVIAIYSFFWNAVLSQFEVVTLSHLREQAERYSQIRLWGSVGFIALVLLLGFAFDYVSLEWLPFVLSFLLLGIWLCSLMVYEGKRIESGHQHDKPSFHVFLEKIREPNVAAFFIICFFVQFSHGPYYTFYSIYMDKLGVSEGMIGALWSLGVAAEVFLFLFMHRLFARFSVKSLLYITLSLTAIRWFLIGSCENNLLVLVFAQLLHAASFGSFHAISIEMVRRFFDDASIGQGQAFYSAVSFGAGGAAGAIFSGIFWSMGASFLFIMAGISICLALFLVRFTVEKSRDS